jgi:molybdate transport system substrate-binding protein
MLHGLALCDEPHLLIAAAADLSPLEKPLTAAAAKLGLRVRFVFGSSGMLARQIENGAPYDLYLSANVQFANDLAKSKHLVPETVTAYAKGRIAVWSASGKFGSLKDLEGSGVRHVAIANPAHAPYGQAARQALENEGLWKSLEGKLVYGENVRQALQMAESGNADVAIVSWTLVFNRGGILLPAELHQPIVQAGGVVAGSRNEANARRFVKFLTGRAGQHLLEAHGLPPR